MTGRLAELARRFQNIIDHITDKPFTWGQGDGTLSDQTDLQTALDGKADVPDEGTFDAEFSTTGDPFTSITFSRKNGLYQVNRNWVTVAGYIQVDTLDKTGASGNLRVLLPFTASSSPTFIYSSLQGRTRNMGSGRIFGELTLNSNVMQFRRDDLSGGTDNTFSAQDLATNTLLSFTIKYKIN